MDMTGGIGTPGVLSPGLEADYTGEVGTPGILVPGFTLAGTEPTSHIIDAANTLAITQLASVFKLSVRAASNTLTITQAIVHAVPAAANNSLAVSQTGATRTHFLRPVSHTLAIAQTAHVNVTRHLAASNTLSFIRDKTVILPLVVQQIAGQPAQGFSYTRHTAMVTVQPARCYVTLTVAGQTLRLPCPEFGDSEAGTGTVHVRQSMTGLTYAYARHGRTRRLAYRFQMGRQKSLELADFLSAHGAKVLQLRNHKAEVWYAVCLTSPFEFEAQVRYLNEEERLEISLEFEGTKVFG